MNSIFFKGLLSVVLGCIASLFAVKGAGPIYWTITILGVVLTYFGQHAALKPVSLFGTIDLSDILKSLLIAVGTGVSTYIASLVVVGSVSWHNLFYSVGATTVAYLSKNLFSNSKGELGSEPKP